MSCDHFENVIFSDLPCCKRLDNQFICKNDADYVDGDDDDNGGWVGGKGRGRMC